MPVELRVPTEHIMHYDATNNTEGLALDTDLLEEKREAAHLRNLDNKQRISRYYNTKVQARPLTLGYWVMKEVLRPSTGLRPTWEGLYELVEWTGDNTFYIKDKDGKVSHHPWNVQHLRYYYK